MVQLFFKFHVEFHMSDVSALPKGACVVVCDVNNKILAVTRPDGKGYGLPGGKVDPGESFSQAASRELWEETGLRVKEADLLPLYQGMCRNLESGAEYDVMSFLVIAHVGTLTHKEQHVRPEWKEWDPYFTTLSPFCEYNIQVAQAVLKKFPSLQSHFTSITIK